MKDKENTIGHLLLESLTKDQVVCMLEVVASVWKEQLHLIVPNPANAYKSDYTNHAAWCKALHELNQDSYTVLLSRWRKKHNRRRNLWRDMKAIGLSV